MPGLTVWATSKPAESDAAAFNAAQACMLHAEDYAAAVSLSVPGLRVGHVGYPHYPIRSFAAGDNTVYFEGRVYATDRAPLDAELRSIAEQAFDDPVGMESRVREWIISAEGEYVVLIASPQRKELLLFTDPLGRLPLYYHADDSQLLLARECKFVQSLKPRPGYDPIGCAQAIWLGYPLGERTPFRDVIRAPGAMLLHVCFKSHPIRLKRSVLLTLNMDDKDTASRSGAQHASELVEIFESVCTKWGSQPDVTQNIVSLSGGHDSRAVAAGLAKAAAPCVATTYLDSGGRARRDAAIAERVAEALGFDWNLLETPAPTQDDAERLIRFKDGLNYIGMAYILSYLDQIVARWGRGALYITGDGGDKVLPDLRPRPGIRSMDTLVEALARKHSHCQAHQAEAVMKLPPGTLVSEMRDTLSQYPEDTLPQKAVHYVVYERGRKWLFEGEDRSRFFLWHTSPFYSFSFFRRCMRVPDRLKRYNSVYREFLMKLSPQCAAIPVAHVGVAPTHRTYRMRLWGAELAGRLPGPLRRMLLRIVFGPAPPAPPQSDAVAYVRSEMDSGGPLADLMSLDDTLRFIDTASEWQFRHLWTVVMLERHSRALPGSALRASG